MVTTQSPRSLMAPGLHCAQRAMQRAFGCLPTCPLSKRCISPSASALLLQPHARDNDTYVQLRHKSSGAGPARTVAFTRALVAVVHSHVCSTPHSTSTQPSSTTRSLRRRGLEGVVFLADEEAHSSGGVLHSVPVRRLLVQADAVGYQQVLMVHETRQTKRRQRNAERQESRDKHSVAVHSATSRPGAVHRRGARALWSFTLFTRKARSSARRTASSKAAVSLSPAAALNRSRTASLHVVLPPTAVMCVSTARRRRRYAARPLAARAMRRERELRDIIASDSTRHKSRPPGQHVMHRRELQNAAVLASGAWRAAIMPPCLSLCYRPHALLQLQAPKCHALAPAQRRVRLDARWEVRQPHRGCPLAAPVLRRLPPAQRPWHASASSRRPSGQTGRGCA